MTYQYIKLAYFEDNFAGDREFIKEIFSIFLEDVPEKMTALHQQLLTGAWEQAAETAHSIKASVKMMGLDGLYDEIIYIEQVTKATPVQADVVGKMVRIQRELALAKAEITHYLQTLS